MQIFDSNMKLDVNKARLSELRRILRKKIYPNYKFIDPRRDQFRRPDFTDEKGVKGGDLTLVMADKIFYEMKMNSCSEEEKASFWKTYSAEIANWFSTERSKNTRAMQESFKRSKFKIDWNCL